MGREYIARLVAWARKSARDQMGRRLAFFLEMIGSSRGHEVESAVISAEGPERPEDCELLVAVAHWRGSSAPAPESDEPAVACLRALLELPVRRLEIVLVTDDVPGTQELVGRLGETGDATIRIERWRPNGWRRHGYHLPWHHKVVFRRALRDERLTHLLYLEDDIAFTAANLTYWLAARAALAPRGLLPGLVRFERLGGRRVLVDQTRSGQHEEAGSKVSIDGIGTVSVRRSLRPYRACALLDRRLAVAHLRASPFRSPLRSLVVRWDLRERAAAGETFGPTDRPLRGVLRPSAVRPPIRDAVLLDGRGDTANGLIDGSLIEHLRPTYSRDPSSWLGKVAVEDF